MTSSSPEISTSRLSEKTKSFLSFWIPAWCLWCVFVGILWMIGSYQKANEDEAFARYGHRGGIEAVANYSIQEGQIVRTYTTTDGVKHTEVCMKRVGGCDWLPLSPKQ